MIKNSKFCLTILSLVLLGLLAAVVFTVYEIRTKNKETSRLLNESNEVFERKELAQSVREIKTSAAEDVVAFENLILVDEKLVSLIESIEAEGKALGLDTKIVSVAKIESKKPEEPVLIKMIIQAEGDWTPTLSLLRAIESLPYKVMMEESNLLKVEDVWQLRTTFFLDSFN